MPIPTFAFTTPQPTPLGLTKSKSGSPRFNATLFPEAFSLPSMTWRASSCVTSATTIKQLHPSAGSTKISQQESVQLLYEYQTCRTRELLWRITVPTLVIVGEKDIITPPAESRALSDGIPNSTLAVIENAGHFPMLEQPLSSIGRFVFFSTSMQVHPIMMVSSTAQLLGVSSTIRLIGKSVKPGRTTRT
jgi:pimeloyl-ACP methyl ester carboxylesterase